MNEHDDKFIAFGMKTAPLMIKAGAHSLEAKYRRARSQSCKCTGYNCDGPYKGIEGTSELCCEECLDAYHWGKDADQEEAALKETLDKLVTLAEDIFKASQGEL